MRYLCHGYDQSVEEIVNGALFAPDNDEMVIVDNLSSCTRLRTSLAALHWQGACGLIFPRARCWACRRSRGWWTCSPDVCRSRKTSPGKSPTRCRQVTGAAGVAVVIEARHMCMMMRGVEKQNSTHEHLGDARRLPRVEQHPPGVPAIDWTEQVVMPQLQPGMARIRVRTCVCAPSSASTKDEILNKQDVLINLTILYGGPGSSA